MRRDSFAFVRASSSFRTLARSSRVLATFLRRVSIEFMALIATSLVRELTL